MFECQECGEMLESADTPHAYGDCLSYRERTESRADTLAEVLRVVDDAISDAKAKQINAEKDHDDDMVDRYFSRSINLNVIRSRIEALKTEANKV